MLLVHEKMYFYFSWLIVHEQNYVLWIFITKLHIMNIHEKSVYHEYSCKVDEHTRCLTNKLYMVMQSRTLCIFSDDTTGFKFCCTVS